MTNYNYEDAMVEDIKMYIDYNLDMSIVANMNDLDELAEYLNETLWADDTITGNGSGSYTYNRLQAREYVLDNMDLLVEACDSFGIEADTIAKKFLDGEWEWMDVTIRCYMLSQAISIVLYEEEFINI